MGGRGQQAARCSRLAHGGLEGVQSMCTTQWRRPQGAYKGAGPCSVHLHSHNNTHPHPHTHTTLQAENRAAERANKDFFGKDGFGAEM